MSRAPLVVSRGTPDVWSQDDWLASLSALPVAAELRLSAQQCAQLAGFMALLQQWNGTYNLTALRLPQEMLTHHLSDCLAVVAPLLRRLYGSLACAAQASPASARVLDVGSGGGLPGVVLAIACPSLVVTCVDTVGKKAAFVRQVAAQLSLPNLRAEHARVESLRGEFHVVVSRAFASLPDFVKWTAHLLNPDTGWWMAMKGKHPADELLAMATWARLEEVAPLHVPGLDAERCLVWMRRNHNGSTTA